MSDHRESNGYWQAYEGVMQELEEIRAEVYRQARVAQAQTYPRAMTQYLRDVEAALSTLRREYVPEETCRSACAAAPTPSLVAIVQAARRRERLRRRRR